MIGSRQLAMEGHEGESQMLGTVWSGAARVIGVHGNLRVVWIGQHPPPHPVLSWLTARCHFNVIRICTESPAAPHLPKINSSPNNCDCRFAQSTWAHCARRSGAPPDLLLADRPHQGWLLGKDDSYQCGRPSITSETIWEGVAEFIDGPITEQELQEGKTEK